MSDQRVHADEQALCLFARLSELLTVWSGFSFVICSLFFLALFIIIIIFITIIIIIIFFFFFFFFFFFGLQEPRLPGDKVREPWQVAWPAIVGYDHIWRHGVQGAQLAKERPAFEHEITKRKLTRASVYTTV